MKKGFYYIVSKSGSIVWIYRSCSKALMDLAAMWANGSHGLMIIYNGALLYRLTEYGIDKIGA